MNRFDALGELIDNQLQQIEQLEVLEDQPNIESSVFELNVKNLQTIGVPALKQIETKIRDLQPSGYPELFLVHEELSDLSKQVTQFLLSGFEFSRQLNREQIKLTDRLNQRLWFSQFSIIYGMLLFGLALAVYLREKQQTAKTLKLTNKRLEVKIRESQRLALELEQRASHDGLSGLLNRRGFNQELESLISSRSGQHGLCFLDIDMFKIVNDTCGHSAGDTLIQVTADLLKNRVHDDGVVARFGGDEFLIMMPNCKKSDFEQLIVVICDELRLLGFSYGGKKFEISGSFGAVHFNAVEQSMQSLMAIVDAACYEAKKAGGARIHFHGNDDSIIQARQSDVILINDIQHALSNDGFKLYYQPIHSLRTASSSVLHGWEVLLRMTDSDNNMVLPQKILNVAERFSFAPKIDRWVVKNAFEWLNSMPPELNYLDCLNINLSGRSIGDRDFLEFLEEQTAQLAVDTSRVCFEITETAIAGEHAREFISRLKDLGYQLALDDFGTGFSSFGYLESLPVDYIKIDGLFVRDIDCNKTHREFVKAISAVGKAMGKAVVAEFVSSQESVDVLKELGIDYAQGYFLGYPAALPLAKENHRQLGDDDPLAESDCLSRDVQVA
jgi:diguanylate cyclase (GGDEF)-like protein